MGRKKVALLLIFLVIAILLLWWFLSQVFAGKIIVSRFIFRVGSFGLRWYSTLIALGILIDYFIARWYFKKRGWNPEHLDEALFWGVVLGIICARAYYVVFEWDKFKGNPAEIFKIWHGGIAIHGGFLGAILAVWLYTKLKKGVTFTFLDGLDVMGWLFPLAQGIGRWGNFFNYEAFGYPTSLPWKMYVPPCFRPPEFAQSDFFHPTFLYESIWDFLIFSILTVYVLRYQRKKGEIAALYLVMYSMGRIMVEALRTDSLWLGSIRMAQLFSAIAMIAGAVWYLTLRSHERA